MVPLRGSQVWAAAEAVGFAEPRPRLSFARCLRPIKEDGAETARIGQNQQRTVRRGDRPLDGTQALEIRHLLGLAQCGRDYATQREELHLRMSLDAKLLDYRGKAHSP
jgi:hypothetical protein